MGIPGVKEAQSVPELVEAVKRYVDRFGNVPGSLERSYSVDDVAKGITTAFATGDSSYAPRFGGIRQKVKELISKEKS